MFVFAKIKSGAFGDDEAAAQFVQRLEPGHPAAVFCMAVLGKSVWVGLSDGSVYVWRSDNKSRQRLRGIGAPSDGSSSATTHDPVRALCPVGKKMWIGAGCVSVWDANERQLEHELDNEPHDDSPISLLLHVPAADDNGVELVVSGSARSSSLVVWNAKTFKAMQKVSVSGERGPRHACLLGSLVIVDVGRFVVVRILFIFVVVLNVCVCLCLCVCVEFLVYCCYAVVAHR